jgi:hypothetical protein
MFNVSICDQRNARPSACPYALWLMTERGSLATISINGVADERAE